VLWGVLNALLIGWGRLPAFVATLGTAGIARGVGYMLCGGTTVDIKGDLGSIAGGNAFGLPVPFWIIVVCAAVCAFVLKKTIFGRHLYAVGGNPQAARFAGINPNMIMLAAYAISGALVGLAAMIEVARNSSSAQPNTGESFPLDAIAAVVIGGASLLGGVGSIAGTVIGALIIAVLRNGLTLLGRDPFEQMVLIGVLIVASVAFDQWRQKK
jgi:ribose transport system permease protein